jgi:hypothetical protein
MTSTTLVLIVCLTLWSQLQAICPNSCSGHGLCGVGNTCTCFEGWDGGAADCSFRESRDFSCCLMCSSKSKIVLVLCYFIIGKCPTGTAWVDKAYDIDRAHQVAECSNAGICDRSIGLCQCFPGYTGSACQRSKQFSFISMLSLINSLVNSLGLWIDTCPNDCSGHGTCGTIKEISFYSGPEHSDTIRRAGDGKGIDYTNWDKDSIQFCECDDGFFGSDCSQGI